MERRSSSKRPTMKEERSAITSLSSNVANNIRKMYEVPDSETNSLKRDLAHLLSDSVTKGFGGEEINAGMRKLLKGLKKKEFSQSSADSKLNSIINSIEEIHSLDNFHPKKILDIGAGSGELLQLLGGHYHLSNDDLFALDKKTPEKQSYRSITYDKDNNIPLQDGSVDMIIMFLVLHHIEENERLHLLKEVSRVLSSDGIIIINEHDDDRSPEFEKYLDMIHGFWYISKGEMEDPLHLMTKEDTEKLFEVNGIISIYFKDFGSHNPQRLYISIFKKTENHYSFENESTKDLMEMIIGRVIYSDVSIINPHLLLGYGENLLRLRNESLSHQRRESPKATPISKEKFQREKKEVARKIGIDILRMAVGKYGYLSPDPSSKVITKMMIMAAWREISGKGE